MNQEQAIWMALLLIRKAEGLRLKPYMCPAGVPTIGYGSTRYADGHAVTMKDQPITAKQADELLILTLRRDYLPGVLKASPILNDKPKALAAVLDFVYNVGVGAYERSKLRKRIDDGDWGNAVFELRRWIKAGGKVLPGLVNRRAEAEKLLKP